MRLTALLSVGGFDNIAYVTLSTTIRGISLSCHSQGVSVTDLFSQGVSMMNLFSPQDSIENPVARPESHSLRCKN